MNLVIDAGNTRTKIGIFTGATLSRREVFTSPGDARGFLGSLVADHVIASSVIDELPLQEVLRSKGKRITLTPELPLPIQNRYATPLTLGSDRLAAACGAWSLFPHEPSLVIDCGTCINYEFVTASGDYLGGAISPGVAMRFKAMNTFTDRLPLAAPGAEAALTGDTTLRCLESGVMNGTLEEIKGIMARYQRDNPGIRVILTGGDAHFFEKPLKPFIFVAPDLILTGLNSILVHNVLH